MGNVYNEESDGDTHPDQMPPFMEADSTFNGTATITWDRDAFAIDLNDIDWTALHKLKLTLNIDNAFSGFEVEWAIVSLDTYEHGDEPSNPYHQQFGGVWDLGQNWGQLEPGNAAVGGLTATIEFQYQNWIFGPPIMIIDIFSAGVFQTDYGPMNDLSYTISIDLDDAASGGPIQFDYVATLDGVSTRVARAGGSFDVAFTISDSQGRPELPDRAANGYKIYLSDDPTITASDIRIGSSLGSHLDVQTTRTVTLPVNLAPGTYYIGIIVDSGQYSDNDTDPNNNISNVIPITVTSPKALNGSTYSYESFNAVPMNWLEARDAAVAKGGHLASIGSQAENDFILHNVISGFVVDGEETAAFIDGSDAGHEGIWQWMTSPSDGTTFWNGSTPTGQYAHWRSGEPNNSGGAENYAVMEGDGTWNDVQSLRAADATIGYIVEYTFSWNKYQIAYANMSSGLAALTDIAANTLATQEVSSGNGSFFNNWIVSTADSPFMQHTTGAVAGIWQKVIGQIPTSDLFTSQVQSFQNNFATYVYQNKSFGLSDLNANAYALVNAYKLWGSSLANDHGATQFQSTYNQNTSGLFGQTAFVSLAFQNVLGFLPSNAQLNANVTDFVVNFKDYYAAAGGSDLITDARAKGAFVALLFKQAQDSSPGQNSINHLEAAVSVFIQDIGLNTAVYGTSIFNEPGVF